MTDRRIDPQPPLARRLAAEGLGTALLLAIVVGSGVMGDRLSNGNVAVALLANAVATGAGLVVLISIFGPVSGAHFNPAVTFVSAMERAIAPSTALAFAAAQGSGAIAGVLIAHAMFGERLFQISARLRGSGGEIFSEAVATFGLVLTIIGCGRLRLAAAPALIGLYIVAAYWFTASTSFANPAVTIARMLTDTFAGVAPASAPAFIAAQFSGAVLALAAARPLFGARAQ